MAILEGGACLLDKRTRVSGPDERMEGYLYMAWHGAHDGGTGRDPKVHGLVNIALDVRGGQFALYFCSTGCLRAFLNACVDHLESKVARQRCSIKPSNKRLKSDAQKRRVP